MPEEQGGELKTDIITLTAHILQKQQIHKEANGDFSVRHQLLDASPVTEHERCLDSFDCYRDGLQMDK